MKLFDWKNKRTLLIQVGMFVVSLVCFVMLMGWRGALIFMPVLMIHEMGHLWMMERFGLKVTGVYFTPLGAVAPAQFRRDFKSEAWIGIMGPLWGFGSALFGLICFLIYPHIVFFAFFAMAAVLNLFNLIPVLPLDGSRVIRALTGSLSPKWSLRLFIIFTVLGILILYKVSWFMAIIVVLMGWFLGEMKMEYHRRVFLRDVEKHPELKSAPEYPEIAEFYYRDPLARRDKIWLTVTYLGLVAALSGMLFYAWTFVKHLL
jgi:Zn-dependent protease